MPLSAPPTFKPASFGIQLGAAGTVLTSTGATTAPTFQAGGAGVLPGNPTASLGLTAINGVAATFMRSDAAPALDQTIAPTWTGLHTFSNAVGLAVSSAAPRVQYFESGLGANEGLWDLNIDAKVFAYRTRTDADGAGISFFAVTRGATTAISNISFGDATNNNTVTFLGSGTITASGAFISLATGGGGIVSSSSQPTFELRETDLGADLKNWRIDANAGVFKLRTTTDAGAAGVDIIAVTRGVTTAITNISFGNATNNNTTTFLGSGTGTFGGAVIATNFTMSSSTPILEWRETDQGTNLKNWRMEPSTAIFNFRTMTDGGGAGTNIFSVVRGAATAIASIAFGNATDNNTTTFLGSGDVTVNPNLIVTNAAPIVEWFETGVTADEGVWQALANNRVWTFRTNTDAHGSARNIFNVTRTAQTVLDIQVGNAGDNNVLTVLGTGNIKFGGTATGAQTATFVATNKPGAGTSGPIAWLPVLTAGGTQGYIPIFGA